MILLVLVDSSLAFLSRFSIASLANLILVIVFRMAFFGIVLPRKRIFRYSPASRESMSFRLQRPAVTIGVPM